MTNPPASRENLELPAENQIVVSGACTRNLRKISLRIPLGCFTAVVGVSGSGKSSLVLDTIHAESQRRYF